MPSRIRTVLWRKKKKKGTYKELGQIILPKFLIYTYL